MVNVDSSASTQLCGVHVTRRLALIGGVVFVLLLTTVYLLLDASMASARAHSLATNHT
jgi:tetrahydromethanopterin S-methyltransferase subunit G